MSSPTHQVRAPIVDTPVFSADGHQAGYVSEIHGGYFKLDVPMAKDYWLSTVYIAGSTLDRVSLTLKKDEMDEHRLSAPGAEAQDPDFVISDVQALSQRERMERELAAQNERLRRGDV
ncbi:MAG: hypothetical protein U0837_07655 [Dehalococcoidia bacterium]|jgi:hypothetical protein